MSKKEKLLSVLAKFKAWSAKDGDDILDNHIHELEYEINSAEDNDDQGNSDDDQGGNNPGHKPPTP